MRIHLDRLKRCTRDKKFLQQSSGRLKELRNKFVEANKNVRAEVAKVVVPGGHVDQVWGMAASPDGRWFATASHDATVKLWDASTQQLLRTFEGQDELAW